MPKEKPNPKPKPKRKKRHPILAGLRWDILVKSRFRCQACGVPSKQARLEIDHIIPIAKGGKNELKNLQVLCLVCNRGKGAKVKKVTPKKK